MRFFLSIIIVVSLFSFNCSDTRNTKEIEFWTLQLSPVFNDYFNSLIYEFEKNNPEIKVKWVDIPYDAVIQKLLASLIAGNAPDVVNLSSDFLSKFNRLNTLVDLKKHLNDSILDQYLPNALEANIFGSKLVALPWYLNTYVLIYNKKLIYDAGFTFNDIPSSFNELAQFTKKYKDKTGKFALFINLGKDSFLPMILESEGVSLTNPEMTLCTINTKEGIEVVETWVNLYKEGYLQSESLIQSGSSIIEKYQSGQVAMVFTGPVFLRRVKDNAEQIYNNTDIAPAVVGKTGKHELAVMSVSVMATTKKINESLKFLTFLLNADNQLKFSYLATIYPSTKKSLESKYFTESDSTLETKARILGASQINSAVKLNKYLGHPKFDLLKSIFEETIQKACLNKISVQEALNIIETEWNKILISDES